MKAELVLGNLKREREALNNKLERLDEALSKEWQDVDQEYLCTQQYNAMALYAHILDERIVDIECKLEEKKLKAREALSHETCHEDKKIFKDDVDLSSYKKDMNNCCANKQCCCDGEDIADIIKTMMEDIFDIEIIWNNGFLDED